MPPSATKRSGKTRLRDADLTIGVDLGATRIKVGVLDAAGNSLLAENVVAKTEATRPVEVGVRNVLQAVREARKRASVPWTRILGVGIGSPGSINSPEGVIIQAVNFSSGWNGLPMCKQLSKPLGVPVILENDANAFAFAEYNSIRPRLSSLVVLTLGTGLGSGLVRRGRILPIFEAGHIDVRGRDGRPCRCGQNGCLEAYVSTTALRSRAKEVVDGRRKTRLRQDWKKTRDSVRAIFNLARDGDRECEKLVDSTARFLADGCRTVMHMHAPDEIHLNGGMAALGGDEFAACVEAYTRERVLKPLVERTRVRRGILDPQSGWIGAAYLARERITRSS